MENEKTAVLTAYKGFDKDLKCKGFRYEIGKTYHHAGSVAVCASGFHACLNPLDVFNYYSPPSSRFCIVDAFGEIQSHHEDSKIASASITIQAEIKLPEIIKNAVSFVMGLVNASKTTTATTGYYAHATTTGDLANATTTGERSHATTTGESAHATTTGYYANATTTGERSHAATTGDLANATTTGYYAHAATTGESAHAATTGESAHATTTGESAHATTTGGRANATTTGERANAATTGERANAATAGAHAVACALGFASKARASACGAIVLVCRNSAGELLQIRASKVGENGIKPDTWYSLDAQGNFVEADDE